VSRTYVDTALRYAARGWPVFPCHEPRGGRCSCGRPDCASPAKHPRTARGLHDATHDPSVIAGWWQRWPTANVAVRTGAASGLVVLDVDPDHGGLATLAELQRIHGGLPPSPAVRTGSGGRHYWFAHPGDNVRNSAGLLGPGLDIRGDGGYVIAPPSIHAAGSRYFWASEVALAPTPGWLLERCREQDREKSLAKPAGVQYRPHELGAWAAAAFESELGRIRQAAQGTRNHTLNRAAFALGQLVGSRHLDGVLVHEALVAAGTAIGLTKREVRTTVASGMRAGRRSPRSPSRLQPLGQAGLGAEQT
jgi:hypothetical protein